MTESPVSAPEVAAEYPFILITGGNFRPTFHSENRHWGMGAREQHPDPIMERASGRRRAARHPGRRLGLCGDPPGHDQAAGHVIDEIHPRVVNVLTMGDDPDTYDPVTGGWPLRALCKVYKAEEAGNGFTPKEEQA